MEQGLCQAIPDASPIMVWMARWAVELISKYVPGEDGRTPYERLRKESCKVPLVPFGETVMFLPMKTATSSKGEPAKRAGIWLGIIERIEETIIGTKEGVVKCRSASRLANGNQWNKDLVMHMRGWLWEPILGKPSMHIPVEIHDNGEDPERDYGVASRPIDVLDEHRVEVRGSSDTFHISRKAINKYGMTIGCPGCNDLANRGQRKSTLIYNHSDECRNRIIDMMKGDPEYKRLLEKHGYAMALDHMELRTKERLQEINHNIQGAIDEIEKKVAREVHGVKLAQLDRTMRILLFEQMDVVEVYSRPRIANMAEQMGFRAGWGLDITTCNETGEPWDFNCPRMRNEAVRTLLRDKPRLSIGSQMCGPFSSINNLNYARMIEEEKHERISYGRKHLEFCCKLYEIQWREGRYFMHEHPQSASSWHEGCIKRLLHRHGVVRVVGDQCQFGLTSYDGYRRGFAHKRIGFLTNSPCIAKRVSLRCPNTKTNKKHDHVILINGSAKAAQEYPLGLCQAVCKGLIEQIEADKFGQFLIAEVNKDGEGKADQMNSEAKQLKEKHPTVEEDNGEELELAWDDVSGAKLDPVAVKKARAEEVEYVREMKLYSKVHIEGAHFLSGG